MVSAWATANHISLGQVVVDEKSNEITAIPKLLQILEISGCLVSGKNSATFNGHTNAVWSVAFSPDNTTLSGSDDKTIKLWDLATGKNTATLNGHTETVHSVTFSPDGKTLASGSFDRTVKLWDLETGKSPGN
jgi:WD40 repeat protein